MRETGNNDFATWMHLSPVFHFSYSPVLPLLQNYFSLFSLSIAILEWLINHTVRMKAIDKNLITMAFYNRLSPKVKLFSISLLVCKCNPRRQTWYQKFIGDLSTLEKWEKQVITISPHECIFLPFSISPIPPFFHSCKIIFHSFRSLLLSLSGWSITQCAWRQSIRT